MSRPLARVLSGVPSAPWEPLQQLPPEAHDERGRTVVGVVADEQSVAAALDALLRGYELHIFVVLDEHAREAFLDQLARIAEVQRENDSLPPDETTLLEVLRAGGTLQDAAAAAGMSRRTAARRLHSLRVRFGVRTVAELVILTRD